MFEYRGMGRSATWVAIGIFAGQIGDEVAEIMMTKSKIISVCEFSGSVLAMAYALLIASNTGNEILGFSLLLISALLFAGWGFLDKRWAFFALQFFYAASAIIGLWRWA
jgi:hypothetical protein